MGLSTSFHVHWLSMKHTVILLGVTTFILTRDFLVEHAKNLKYLGVPWASANQSESVKVQFPLSQFGANSGCNLHSYFPYIIWLSLFLWDIWLQITLLLESFLFCFSFPHFLTNPPWEHTQIFLAIWPMIVKLYCEERRERRLWKEVSSGKSKKTKATNKLHTISSKFSSHFSNMKANVY